MATISIDARHIPALKAWYRGSDTGVSSLTIFCAATGQWSRWDDAPYDADDFGRCYRLVRRFPWMRESFPAVADVCPPFRPILDAWDELCALYADEPVIDCKCPKLNRRLRELRAQESRP